MQRLTGMERQKILDELADIQRRIAEYLEILGSDKVLRDLIVKELKEVQKEYGDERRTQIIEEDTGEIRLEDLVAVEDVAVTVTRGGYLKRTSVDTYRRQTRGGKGRIGMGTRAEDFVEYLIVASTHAYLLIFTTRGRRLLAEGLRDSRRHHHRARASTFPTSSTCSRMRPSRLSWR